MKGRTPTADERRHMAAVAELGCCVCRRELGVYSPAAIHHIDGKTRPGAHFKVLGLCPMHHQTGGGGVALHAGRVEWERLHGTQADLLRWVAERITTTEDNSNGV